MKVKLTEIAGHLDMLFDEISLFYSTENGRVYPVRDEEMRVAEREDGADSHPDWQEEGIGIARRVLREDCFVRLPSQYEVHEYGIMEDFVRTVEDPEASNELEFAIRGKGAFRMFKHTCRRFDLVQDWRAFRAEALRQIARRWCIDNGLEYEE